jgi:hypothetical protein
VFRRAERQAIEQSLKEIRAKERQAIAAAEAWLCPACTFRNEASRRHCSMCDTARPEAPPEAKQKLEDMDTDIPEDDDGALHRLVHPARVCVRD